MYSLVSAVISAAEASKNEAQLRHELEKLLEQECLERSIPWTPFQLERALKAAGKPTKFADVAHGAVIIEYESPKSFDGRVGSKALHERLQAEEYVELISAEEGRPLREYVPVACYGAQLSLGASIAEYLLIPAYSETNPQMEAISKLVRVITAKRGVADPGEIELLEMQVHALLNN